MTRRLYTGPLVDVSYDRDICRHFAECVRGMPAVFANNVQRNARFHAVLAIASNRAIAEIYMPLSCAYAARPANARPGGAEATTSLTY